MYTDVIDLVWSFSYKIMLEGYTHLYVQYMVPSLQNVLLETPSFIRKKTPTTKAVSCIFPVTLNVCSLILTQSLDLTDL